LILAPTQGFETASQGMVTFLAWPSLESNIRVGPMGLLLEIYDKKKEAPKAPLPRSNLPVVHSSLFLRFCLGFFFFKQALSFRTNAQSFGL
jgi:hypothetical protein